MVFLKMTDKEIIEKIYRKLDGELTATELFELENYLAGHPEAAQFAKEWELIKQQVENEKLNPSDFDLRKEILKKIDVERYKQPEETEILIKPGFWSRPAFRSGSTFVIRCLRAIKEYKFKNL